MTRLRTHARCVLKIGLILKLNEEVATLPAEQLPTWLAHNPQRLRGEFTLEVHHAPQHTDEMAQARRVMALLLTQLPFKTAVPLTADITV